MGQQGGFSIQCKNEQMAKEAKSCAEKFLKTQGITSPDWQKITLTGSSFGIDYACFIDFNEYDGVFVKICENVEACVPGAIVSGNARYWQTVTDFTIQESVSRNPNGKLAFGMRNENWDLVDDLNEAGFSVSDIAVMTGMTEDEIKEYLGDADEGDF